MIIGRIINFIVNLISIVVRFLPVLFSLIAINSAEKSQTSKSVPWGILSFFCYIIATGLAAIATIVTTDSPLSHLKEINTTKVD
jgi:uncharacterized membrane protein YbhN (UPF0104 family)